MKKIIFSIFAIIFFFTNAICAQSNISIADIKSPENSDVLVSIVSDENLSGVGSLTFDISYDTNVLNFNDEIVNNNFSSNGTFSVNHSDGVIKIGWFSTTPVNITDTLFVLKFGYTTGVSSLDFVTNEITDVSGEVLPNLVFNNGSVGPEDIQILLGSKIAGAGDTVTVPVNAINLKDVGSLTLFINYDDTVVDFVGLDNDVYGINANAANDVLTLAWYTTTSPLTIYSGKVVDLVFVLKEGKTDLTVGSNSEVTDSVGNPMQLVYTNGFISDYANQPAFLSLPTMRASINNSIVVPISGKGIKNLGSATLKIEYDDNRLEFTGYENLVSGTLEANSSNGVITLGYFNASGLNMDEGVFVDLMFNYTSGNADLTWDQNFGEITDLSGAALEVSLADGLISSNSVPAFTAVLPDTSLFTGDTLAFNYAGTDANPDALTFALVSGPDAMTVSSAGALSWVASKGDYTVVVSLTDGIDMVMDTAMVSVPNRAPAFTAVLPDTSIKGGLALSFTYAGSDPDGDDVMFALVSGPDAMTVDSAGTLAWTPELLADSTYTVVVSISDGTDSVNDTANVTVTPGALELTIVQIQTPAHAETDSSAYVGQVVTTSGVVTAIDTLGSAGYFLQDGTGEYSGVWVYDNTNSPAEGDNITITAVVAEYYNLTELDNVSSYTVNSSDNALPAAELISISEAGEPYESVLVKVEGVEVINIDAGFGEWLVTDGTDSLLIDEQLFDYVPELGAKLDITGPLNYSFSNFKIAPRNMGDIVVSAEALISWWEKSVTELPFIDGNNSRGMALNPVTKNVLVPTRANDNFQVYVFRINDGALIDSLDMSTYVDAPHFDLNQIVVSDDGVIYASNMIGWSFAANNIQIYRWADEQSAPTLAFDAPFDLRNGDAMGISGTGADTKLYLSGTNSTAVNVLSTVDGETFTLDSSIPVDASIANGGIAPAAENALWINGGGQPVRLIDNSGAVLATVNAINSAYWDVDYLESSDGKQYLAVSGGAEIYQEAQVWDVTDLNNPLKVYTGTLTGEAFGNGFGLGAVDLYEYFDEGVSQGLVLATMIPNNAVAVHGTFEAPLVDETDKDVEFLTHTPGDLSVSAFNNGEIGVTGVGGVGIDWKGYNGLWRAATIWGRSGAGYAVGDAHQNGGVGFADLTRVTATYNKDGLGSTDRFDQVTPLAVFTDGDADTPYGIDIMQKTLSNTGENYVFWLYIVQNNTAETIDDLHIGMFLDYDIADYTANDGGYSESEYLAYQYVAGSDSDPYFGVAAINGWSGTQVSSDNIESDPEFRQAVMGYMTNGVGDVPANGDQRTFIGSSFDPIASGEVDTVAFAIVAGDNLQQIRNNANSAFAAARAAGITNIVVGVDDTEMPREFTLKQNYPNPFNPSTTIKFELPEASQVKLSVFNILGETVDVLVNSDMNAGYHSVNWNASNLASGIYFYTIQATSVSGKDFNVVKKMMLLK